MSGRILTDVVVVALARQVCPVCTEGKLEDGRACPRCHGDGLEPFPVDPTCGHKDCGCEGPLTFIGFADHGEQEPVFQCPNGRFTAARYTTPDAAKTVAVDDGQIGWAVLELEGGKRRLGGYVSEAVIAGVPCLRIEVPTAGGACTMIFNAGLLYCLTPTSEEVAKIIAAHPESRIEPTPLKYGHAEGIIGKTPPPAAPGAAI